MKPLWFVPAYAAVFLLLLWGLLRAACDVEVKRIVDGDTFKADTVTAASPTGWVLEETGFRMARVRAPERKQPDFEKATENLHGMIGGKKVHLEFLKTKAKRDRWGRLVVEVFLCGDKGLPVLNVNDEMRRMGWTDKGK